MSRQDDLIVQQIPGRVRLDERPTELIRKRGTNAARVGDRDRIMSGEAEPGEKSEGGTYRTVRSAAAVLIWPKSKAPRRASESQGAGEAAERHIA